MRTLQSMFLVLLFSATATDVMAQAPLPAGWPTRFELGMSDGPGGAAALRATAPFAFRYQYLAGGVNTGSGWSTWNTNGDFARFYIQDSVANNIIPVFTYYMLLQSAPGGGSESDAVYTNANNTATMTAYYNDLKLLFQKAGAFPGHTVVLHVEPDFWGYMQQRAPGDNASNVPAMVAATGLPELAAFPNSVSGMARAIVKLRDTYAPNVILGYHISIWGTGNDIVLSNPSDGLVDALATRAAAFFTSLNANFEIAFAEFSDRDSAFYQHVYGDGGAHWFDADDFRRVARFLGRFSTAANRRIVMWQTPLGNTLMRAQNNVWGHYQDNRPEWFLNEAARTHLTTYRDAGVVAMLFGGGAGGVSCACDAEHDGVTNPPAIGGNIMASELAPAGATPSQAVRNGTPTLVTPYAADDDGGFFRWRAWLYYQNGTLPISPGTVPPPPSNLRIVS